MSRWLKVVDWTVELVALPFAVAMLAIGLIAKLSMLPFQKRGSDELRDFTSDAEALFARFAQRHGLTYVVESDLPMEVCWTFPPQPKLSMPLTLGLQNSDELNFGVPDFWSYFFPFDEVEDQFEHILDAWVAGEARVAITGARSRLLQVREGGRWKTVYGADGLLFPLQWAPLRIVTNEPDRVCAANS